MNMQIMRATAPPVMPMINDGAPATLRDVFEEGDILTGADGCVIAIGLTPREMASVTWRYLMGVGYMRMWNSWHACMRVDVDAEKANYIEAFGLTPFDVVANVRAKLGEMYLAMYPEAIEADPYPFGEVA